MQARGTRRAILASLGAVSVAGCIETVGMGDSSGAREREPATVADASEADRDSASEPFVDALPAECPVTRGLDVEWPRALDPSTAGSFVAAYETEYFRAEVVNWDPVLSVDTYTISFSVIGEPEPRGDGYLVELDLSGRAHNLEALELSGRVRDPPADASVVSIGEIADDRLTDYFRRVATADPDPLYLTREETDLERYLDLFDATFDDYETLLRETLHNRHFVDVDGTIIEVHVGPASTGYEYPDVSYWYYVDERILVRSYVEPPEGVADGTLVECRER